MSDRPLAERVSAPATLSPAAVDGIRWRPATPTDVDALVEVGRAIALADHPDWADTREDLLDELGHSYTDLAVDSLVAVTDAGSDSDAGEVVAWGLVVMPDLHETLVRVILLGGVVPEHRGRGIGRALLAWQHGRALQRLAGCPSPLPGWIIVAADERAPATGRTLERAGFAAQRWFQNLARTASEPVPASAPVGGIRVVSYRPEHSADAHRVRDAAFRGVGSSQPMTDEQWESMTTLTTFAHDLSFVALDAAGEVVGLLLTLVDTESSGDPDAYVWVVGVLPASRGRGAARALLIAHLQAVRAAGVARSVLDVATDGPDEGLALFTGLGYRRRSASVNFVRRY